MIFSAERFCEQIKNGVKESEVPIIKVVNNYCEGKWQEFKKTWTKELVDTQSNVEVAVLFDCFCFISSILDKPSGIKCFVIL
jgi:N-formylglutamate amidohydrolase